MPTPDLTWDYSLRMYVPKEVVPTVNLVTLGVMAVAKAVMNRSKHPDLESFSDGAHGWAAYPDKIDLFATWILRELVHQKRDDLDVAVAIVHSHRDPADLRYCDELQFPQPVSALDFVRVKARALPLDAFRIIPPRPAPSLTTLLDGPQPPTAEEVEVSPGKRFTAPGFHPGLRLDTIILGPTPGCPARCAYCYIPEETLAKRDRMEPSIATKLAEELEQALPFPEKAKSDDRKLELLLHLGEPTLAGIKRLKELLDPFEALREAGWIHYSMQTNATLITDKLCEEVLKPYKIGIGVSIDGPREFNQQRRLKPRTGQAQGAEMFDRTMHGIQMLRAHNVPFSVISVVTTDRIEEITANIDEYLDFFRQVAAVEVGFNIEDYKGAHATDGRPADQTAVKEFWQALATAWREAGFKPSIRDFGRAALFIENPQKRPADSLLTINHDGQVAILVPDMPEHPDFTLGNIETSTLDDMIEKFFIQPRPLISAYLAGSLACARECGYFDYCTGSYPAPRLSEHGHVGPGANQTPFCQNNIQAPFAIATGQSRHTPPASQPKASVINVQLTPKPQSG